MLDLEAFLYGLATLPPDQQNMLAITLNERLADLYESVKIPYLVTLGRLGPPAENPLDILQEHLRAGEDTTQPPLAQLD